MPSVLVTGAARGIGRATTLRLAADRALPLTRRGGAPSTVISGRDV